MDLNELERKFHNDLQRCKNSAQVDDVITNDLFAAQDLLLFKQDWAAYQEFVRRELIKAPADLVPSQMRDMLEKFEIVYDKRKQEIEYVNPSTGKEVDPETGQVKVEKAPPAPPSFEQQKAGFPKEHGVKLLERGGRLEYHLTVNGQDLKLCESQNSPEGLKDAAKQLDALVEKKEQELHAEYGVMFAKPGDSPAYYSRKKYEIRPARVNELYGLELAMAHSKPSSFVGMKVEFIYEGVLAPGAPADQGRSYEEKCVDFSEHDGQQVLRVSPYYGENLPIGDMDLVNGKPAQDDSIEGWMIHEFAHASERRWSGVRADGKPVYDASRFELDHYAKMGWVMSAGAQKTWLLEGPGGSLYKYDNSGDVGTGNWTRVDINENPLDADGKVTDQEHAFKYSYKAMADHARVNPSSCYFDTPREEYAEAMKFFRLSEQTRKQLCQYCPELYRVVKAADQQEINESKAYGVDADGNPRYIRGADGQLVPNTPDAREAVRKLEDARPPGQ